MTVRVAGDVDMATAGLLYKEATPEGARRLTLDLTAVPFFDSAGIHTLIRLTTRYPDSLTVIPSPRVRRVLEITGLGGEPWLAP